ncbi:MAG: patatin-like phospholipase family protein [Burkholderiales bacterium]
MMRKLVGSLILFLGCNAALSESPAPTNPARPRIALVLSGGGARGLAHVGVLQVLEKMKVPVDCVAGTSMGALVGGAFAAGVDTQTMRDVLRQTDIDALFDDQPPRSDIPQRLRSEQYRPLFDFSLGFKDGEVQLPFGASAGYKFELFLKRMIGPGAAIADLDFDSLPTPYRGVATDLESGEMRVFERGDLAKVMRASMSLPAIVAPTAIDGRLYVDGGLVRNLPVDIGRQLCGDIVIAVSLGTPLHSRDKLRNVIDVASQSVHLMMENNVRDSLGELTSADVLIEPDLTGFGSSDFGAKAEIIERGLMAAQAKAAELSRLVIEAPAYEEWVAARKGRALPVPEIARLRVNSSEGFNANAVERDLNVGLGKDFRVEELERDIALIYGRADFSYLGYSLMQEDGGTTLVIDAETKPWGPGFLKFGLGALSDSSSPTQLNFAASYRRTWANSLGGEWRVDGQIGYVSAFATEFFQPLQVRDGAFVAPYASAQRTSSPVYSEEIRLGEFRIGSLTGGVDFGLSGTEGELRIGPYIGRIRSTPEFGALTPLLPGEDVSVYGTRISGIADHLDSPRFPLSGWFAAADVRDTHRDGHVKEASIRAMLTLRGVKSFGRNVLSAHAEVGDFVSGEQKIDDAFKLGGPQRLSGLYLDQLTGGRYQLGTLSAYRQYARLPSQIGRGLYLGMSAEAGRMDDPLMKDPWDWVYAGSIYWGADTILGVIYLGLGYSSLGQGSAYIMIGPRF